MKLSLKIIGLSFLTLIDIKEAAASLDTVDAVEKTFDYFEDTISPYCVIRDLVVSEETKKEAGESIFARRESIIDFAQKDAKKIKAIQLVDYDIYALANGILKRALRRDLVKLEEVDLMESKLTETAVNVLFSALVNRGICDNWGKGEDGKNYLEDLKIYLPVEIPDDDKKIAMDNKIFFIGK